MSSVFYSWIVPPEADIQHWIKFSKFFLIFFVIPFSLVLIGQRKANLRVKISWILCLFPPIFGILFPMLNHTGDPSEELFRYMKPDGPIAKSGEVLGTLLFSIVGRILKLENGDEATLSRTLAFLGVLPALFIRSKVKSTLGFETPERWLLSSLLLYSPLSLFFAGFAQTTYPIVFFLPFAIYLLHRNDILTLPAVSFLSRLHMLGILLIPSAVLVFYKNKAPLTKKAGVLLISALVFLSVKLISQEKLGGDSWAASHSTFSESLTHFAKIIYHTPKWVPILGDLPITCGQQATFFSLHWFLLVFSALSQSTLIFPFLFLFYTSIRKLKTEYKLCFLASIGFTLTLSPHYGFPKDVDVLVVPAFLVLIGIVDALKNEAYTHRLKLIALIHFAIVGIILALQYSHGNSLFQRGISESACSNGIY